MMIRSQWLGAATAIALLGGLGISAAEAQQAGSATALQPKPGAEAQQQQQAQPGSTVENGAPASPHQQQVIRGDENAQPGQNMTTTGPAGQGSAETPHQQGVLKPQTGQSQ